jgi:hypothetical protein
MQNFIFGFLFFHQATADVLYFTPGISSVINSGVSANVSYTPYFNASYKPSDLFKLKAGYARIQDYQILDGQGNYDNVNINQFRGDISFYPNPYFEALLSGKISLGDKDFSRQYGLLSLELHPIKSVSFSFEPFLEKMAYSFDNIMPVEESASGFQIGVTPHLTKKINLELAFNYSDALYKYDSLENDYSSKTLRLGVTNDLTDYLNLGFGFSGGSDSSDMSIVGFDLGLSLFFLDRVSLNLFYFYTYNYYSLNTASGAGGKRRVPQVNPYSTSASFYNSVLVMDFSVFF